VRQALLKLQQDFAAHPPNNKKGAVLDGRDIGTVVCPHANIKIFVTADPTIRAQRRQEELQNRGFAAIQGDVQKSLQERDERDSGRKVAPLMPAGDAYLFDTSKLSADEAFAQALAYIAKQK
jgi:cytidylate kinase